MDNLKVAHPRFFLGFLKDPLFNTHLKKCETALVGLLTNGAAEYIQEWVHEKNRYLGKFIDPFLTFEELESLHAHVLSILKKLTPEYTFSESSLKLIPIYDE